MSALRGVLVLCILHSAFSLSALAQAVRPFSGRWQDITGKPDLTIYLPSTAASAIYLPSTTAAALYQPAGSYLTPAALAPYLTSSAAASIYLPSTAASAIYLPSTTAAALYQPVGSYLTPAALSPYLPSTTAASIYLPSTSAAALYQPLDSDLTAIAALTTSTAGRNLLTGTSAGSISIGTVVLNGTGGSGFLTLPAQSTPPGTPASGLNLHADSSGRLAWRRASDGWLRTFDSTLTGNRVWTMPNADTVVPIATQTLTFTGSTAATSITLPSTTAFSVAMLNGSQTFRGTQSITGPTTSNLLQLSHDDFSAVYLNTRSTNGVGHNFVTNDSSGFIGLRTGGTGGNNAFRADNTGFRIRGDGNMQFGSNQTNSDPAGDTFLSRLSAGFLRVGSAASQSTGSVAATLYVTGGGSGPHWRAGAGSPEGVVTAPIGSIYSRTDGGANTTLYIKETGTGATGWVAK